ncbi:UNVERIFIED_CONTAM: ATP-binding cassette, sub-B (MDR TAP), member 8 [Siphonaria sp. JEL0065]|nr:ATP-binding cassette, sub-B (MDR TAP), member 8 [Siphonaria sp. JEL0065]
MHRVLTAPIRSFALMAKRPSFYEPLRAFSVGRPSFHSSNGGSGSSGIWAGIFGVSVVGVGVTAMKSGFSGRGNSDSSMVHLEGPPVSAVEEKEEGKEDGKLTTWELTGAILLALAPDALLLTAIVLTTGATAAVNIATPTVIGELVAVIQALSVDDNTLTLHAPALKLLLLFAAQGLLTALDINLVTVLGERLSRRLKHDLYASLMRMDMAFFDQNMHGELVGRLSQDIAEFKHTFKLIITQGLKCATQIVFTTLHLVTVSQKLSLALLATMPILYIAMNLYGIFLRRLSKSARVGDSMASSVAGEAISNIRTVRAFAAEAREVDHYMNATLESSKLNSRLGFHIGMFQGITNFSIGSMILVILAYGGNLVGRGELTGGQLMTYLISTQNAQKSLASLGVLFGQAIKALGSASRIFEYIKLNPTIKAKENAIIPTNFEGSIEFNNVTFRYPTRPDQVILDRFSLHIPVGKVVALCGASGSGKSTVGQLIERFYDVGAGSVLIDGVDIRDLDPSWIRNHIGYINQEPILFAASIYENIKYGAPDATRQEVEWAAKQANAADFIESFPDRYDTVVGERGVTLSGGQKQRIAIARAILKDPKFLILDEATSALDAHSERIVQEALEKLMKDRTVLVIAHRLSTIQKADMIVVMSGEGKEKRQHGNVVEMGTHSELISKRGAYYRLYQQLTASSGAIENAFRGLVGVFRGG